MLVSIINPRCMSWRAVEMNRRVDATRIEAYNNFPQAFPVITYLNALCLQGPTLCRTVKQVKFVICVEPASISEPFSLCSVSPLFPAEAQTVVLFPLEASLQLSQSNVPFPHNSVLSPCKSNAEGLHWVRYCGDIYRCLFLFQKGLGQLMRIPKIMQDSSSQSGKEKQW